MMNNEKEIIIYGCDFSGAKDPSEKIYYAKGFLYENQLEIVEVVKCDDRLDLFNAIVQTKAPWGLDLPFSLSESTFKLLKIEDWMSLLKVVESQTRENFLKFLDSIPLTLEVKCSINMLTGNQDYNACRITDCYANSFSPLKKNNPNLRSMIYGGLKLISYLRNHNVQVYPFDSTVYQTNSRVYEVYPSFTWGYFRMKRSNSLFNLTTEIEDKIGFKIKMKQNLLDIENTDQKDAIVACITLGIGMYKNNIDQNWKDKPENITQIEWEKKDLEGIIIRF